MVVIVPTSLPQPASNTDNGNSAMQRVTDLWFDDGNLIVQAENKEFRIYRNLLASRSSVFSDMASFPQPSGAEDDGGVRTVVLQDSAAEVEHFLRAIYDSSYFEPHPGTVEAPALFGIARLSHKYNVAYLRRRALSHLNALIPTSLEDISVEMIFFRQDQIKLCDDTFDLKPRFNVIAVELVLLAREINATWLLPYAFYVIGSTNIEYAVLRSRLSEADKVVVLKTREKHIGWTANYTSGIGLDTNSLSSCGSALMCKAKSAAIGRAFEVKSDKMVDQDLLQMCWAVNKLFGKGNFCANCQRSKANQYRDLRQKIWKSLPKLVGYDSWEELLELKRQDKAS